MPQTTPQQPDLAERRGQKAWDGRSTPAICRTSPPPPTLQAYETSPSYTAQLGRTGDAVAADGEVPQAEHVPIAHQEGDMLRSLNDSSKRLYSPHPLAANVWTTCMQRLSRPANGYTDLRKDASASSVIPHLVAHPVLDAYAQQLQR